MSSTVASKERNRCARIVREYRDELVRAYVKRPDAGNVQQVLAVIKRLEEMERRMMKVPKDIAKSEKAVIGGEFSVEEMERAEALIAEQETNPFLEG